MSTFYELKDGKKTFFTTTKNPTPISLTVQKDNYKKNHSIVYFKRNNGEILVDHLDESIKHFEHLGYSVELKYDDNGA